jgi:hypothetical protein
MRTIMGTTNHTWGSDWFIEVNVERPKREGTAAEARYELLKRCKTVEEFQRKCKGRANEELGWCVEHGFITIRPPTDAEVLRAALEGAVFALESAMMLRNLDSLLPYVNAAKRALRATE